MNGSINRISDRLYIVKSQFGNGSYKVNSNELGWNCSCPEHIYRGDMKYLYALLDDETRFWIALQVADTKYTANINPLFKNGRDYW